MRLDIVLFDGFDELDALAPYEVLRRAAELGAEAPSGGAGPPTGGFPHWGLGPRFQTRLVALDPGGTATAFYGLRVAVEGRLGEGERPDLVIVPGGGWNHPGPHGARVEAERGALPAALARLHAEGTILAAVCTGAMLLASAGLLRGRPATTHHLALDELRAAGAEVVRARVVDDGDIITAGGVTSGLDLALWLVERFASPALATAIEARLEYECRGTVWRRADG